SFISRASTDKKNRRRYRRDVSSPSSSDTDGGDDDAEEEEEEDKSTIFRASDSIEKSPKGDEKRFRYSVFSVAGDENLFTIAEIDASSDTIPLSVEMS